MHCFGQEMAEKLIGRKLKQISDTMDIGLDDGKVRAQKINRRKKVKVCVKDRVCIEGELRSVEISESTSDDGKNFFV